MSDSSTFGFGKFIPGFEFLQSLGKVGQSTAAQPPFSNWVAPTLSIEEINKRIDELKAVQFWLEQNSKALAATVQALEVQKMTLSALQGMNVNLSEMAKGFPFASAAAAAGQDLSDWPMSAAAKSPAPDAAAPQPAAESTAQQEQQAQQEAAQEQSTQAAGMAAAMQWWGALTQQFQQIAQQAMQDPAQQQAVLKATQMSTDFARTAVKTASDMVHQAVAKTQAAAGSASVAKAGSKTTASARAKPAAKPANATRTTQRAATPKVASAAAKTNKAVKTAAAAKRSSPAKKTSARK